MSKLSMVNGRIVIDGDDASKTNAAAKENAHPFSALREISEARSSKPQLSMVNGKIVMNGDRQAAQPTVPQRRSSNNVMDMAIDSLRNRVANSTVGRGVGEWASRVSNRVQDIWNEDPAERARRQQRRVDMANLIDQLPDDAGTTKETPEQARQKQREINYAQLMDQASSQYEGPTRTETVKTNAYDISNLDAFSNEWNPGEAKEYEYQRTVRNERYNPLSREDRDALIKRYVDVANGATVDEGAYEQLMYDVTKNGGIEQLLKEQQADEASDREYGRQMRGVNLDSMTLLERLGGTLGGIGAGAGKQIAASGLGLVASDLNRTVERAASEDSVTSYQAAFEQTARLWYNELVNGLDTEEREEQVRRLAAYVGGDAYADAVVNRVRERASSGDHTLTYGLLDGLNPTEGALWENSQKVISDTGIYDAINRLQEGAENDIQRAKDVNLIQGSFGDALVEGAVSAVQNAADAAITATLGLSGTGIVAMIPFALRAYGGTYAEQMNQATQLGGMIGRDVAKKAAQSAGISSAIEVGTEMMWGIVGSMSKVTGGGALDDAAQQKLADVISGWAKTENGRKILTAIGEKALGGVTEGLEEVIGDAAEQILKNAGIMPGEGMEFSEWVKEAGHSFVTGAIGGLLGEVSNVVATPLQQAQIGKQLKNGGITLSDGTKLTVDDMVNLANTPGMEGTTLEQTYSSMFKGMPRSTEFTDRELGKLYEAYEETMGRSEEGAERVQEILGKVENGEELKRSDVNRITNNPDAVRYLQSASGTELNLDGNITERKAAVEEALRAFASQNETLRNAMAENLSPNAENANTGDLASRIENLPMINRQAMPAEIARSYFDASVGQTVNDAAERMGIGEEGRKIMSGLYSGNRENAIDYVGEMTKPYNLGRENKDLNLEDIPANGTVSAEEYQAAWRAGRLDYLAETARKEINNDRAGQEVLVREGTERVDGQNPVGSSAAVGEIAGSPQVGTTGLQQRSAGTERVYSGTQVGTRITENQLNARDMAAAGYNVVTDNNDAEANAVKNEVTLKAKKYGINVRDVVLFRGAMANVNGSAERGFFIYHPDGTITIAAQLDNADATGRQIITHEFTHALIKNLSVKLGRDALGNLSESGESSFGTIRDYMAQELGGQDKLVEAVNGYAAVYKAAGIIAADANGNVSKADMQMVFEEMICDFVAGMNAFSEVGHISQAVRSAPVMTAAKKAVEKLANETRGSPAPGAYLPRTPSEQESRYTGNSEMYAIDPNGRKYSLGSLRNDIIDNKFQNDLVNKLGWTQNQVKMLVASLNDLMDFIKPNRDILDLNEEYTRETRPYSPYKPNSDPLYKISLDYSTLCRKRLMTQYIIEKLQLREHRPMSGEEQIAIRDMLKEYRQIENGLQVACAMCYVEAARLKSPDQMNRYFDDPEPVLKNYFAQKNKAYKRKVENLQKKWKTERGYEATATKKEMTPADVVAFNEYSSKVRHDYNPETDQADAKRRKEELAAIERAKNLSPDNYLSAENLANLKEQDPLVYDAYTSNIRAATRSKGLETDVPYYYGDSRRKGGPSDKFIKNVNAENGMRFSSWSDFQFTHLLDQMMAVIDLSVRKAAMHGYTKFPEQVRIFGKTGAMFNMSGVPDATGLNSDGSLRFSPTESIDIEEARRLRDQFPETAGVQCIGISDEHVKALLRSDFIDYVIPYHVSGLNAVLRQMVKIASWQDYTGSQEESVIDSKAKWEDSDRKCPKDKWHKGPVFSEFFDPAWYTDPAYKGRGVEAMREAAKRYVQMCADRGMRPKFTQFLGEENYWKLLIDRKMVNQKTGDLIQQKPVTPDFDFDVIKKEIADYVEKTRAEQGIEDRAFDYVAEHWDEMPGRIAALKQEGAVEKNIAKAEERKRRVMEHQANVLGNEMYAAAPKNVAAYKYSRDLDSAGNKLTAQQAEYFANSTVRDSKGRLKVVYHGTTAQFNTFKRGDIGFHFGNKSTARTRVGRGKNTRLIEAYLNITNPIVFDEDLGSWDADYRLTQELFNKGIVTKEEGLSVLRTDSGYKRSSGDANNKLRSLLESKGYDGITYPNSFESSGSTSYIAFEPNQAKLTTDENPTDNADVRFSRDLSSTNNFDSLYTTLEDGRIKPNNVEDLSTEDWKLIYKAVNKLGYGLESAKQAKEVYSRYVGQGGFNKEQSEAIKKAYGVVEDGGAAANPKREALARKTFGTTGDFREAGYLMRNGSMLDFSGKKDGGPAHVRYMDHREIGSVFGENEIPEDKRRYRDNSAYMNAFISEGNIRLMDGQGVTIGEMEPTPQQYKILKQFIERVLKNEDYFYLDLSNNDGYTVASRDYEGRDGADKIVREIKAYFKNGELPYRSSLHAFFSRDLSSAYMAAAESGDTETAQRLVDEAAKEAGYDMHLYHGAKKGGGFTRFKDWSYFTANKQYAERYQQRDNPDSLYDVYVKSDRMFDTRKKKDRAIFEKYREEYGMSELQNSGLPDWTDGYDIVDFIEENGLDYDGIVLDEGGDMVDGKPVSRGESYVIRKSDQVKSASAVTRDDQGNIIPLEERFNSKNDDIRFSRELKSEATREAGEKLTERQFYSLYSAHKLDMRNQGDVEEQIQKIRSEGFKGTGGFTGNTMPTNLSYKVENGERKPANVSVDRYAPRKGDRIMFVPRSGINSATDSVKLGYRPMFDYEIVTADYDYQPYYEMYSKAYDQAKESNAEIRYSRDLAPVFYSKLEREIEKYKGDKIGAASAISYLKGKGVKDEDIKWSGINTFLEGKKSVDKAELLEYIKSNRIKVEEVTLDNTESKYYVGPNGERVNAYSHFDPVRHTEYESKDDFKADAIRLAENDKYSKEDITFTFDDEHEYWSAEVDGDLILEAYPPDPYDLMDSDMRGEFNTIWDNYTLDGGSNYREILFTLPDSDYINAAMRTHWRRPGVLAHARIQDFESNGLPVLFADEIQSDWHNAGEKSGYGENGMTAAEKEEKKNEVYERFLENPAAESLLKKIVRQDGWRPDLTDLSNTEDKALAVWTLDHRGDSLMASLMALGKATHVEVLAYDEFRRDLDILGKQSKSTPDAPFRNGTYIQYVLKDLLRKAAEDGYDYLAWTSGKMQEERWSSEYAEGYRIEYDQDIPSFLKKYGKQWGATLTDITLDQNGEKVPAIAITGDMKDSVLYEGQPMFSRDLSNTELYEANHQLQKDLTELRSKLKTRTEQYKYWKGQTKVTEGRQLRTDDVTKLAREIIKGQESSADAKAVAEKMKALGEYILNTTDENVYDEARQKAYEIAHDILANAKTLNTKGGDDFYSDFRTALKQTPIYVTPSVREEVSPDGWSGLRQMAKGIFTPTADKSKGKTVDVIYHDLQSTFGEWLLPEYVTSEADQLNKIFEVVETYQPVYENINSYDMADAVEWTANEILTRIIGEEIRETNPTYADRMEKKLSDQKVKSQEALRRVREQRDRKVQNLKEHYQQVAEDRRNRKIDSEMRTRLLNIAKRLNNKKLDRVQRALLDKYIGDLDLVSKSLTGRTIHDLEYLKTFYEAYKERMGEDFIPDKFIEKKIDRLNKKHISDMTQEEVADLTTVLLNLETLIRTENKLIDSQIKADIYAAGSQTIDDVNNSNGKDTFLSKAIGAETATPERYLHRITGYRENSPLYQAAKELSDGQRKMLDYQMRAESLFLKWTRDKKFTRRIAGKHAEEITISGRVNGEMTDVKITPAMRMALYLHEQNDDNMRHISQGGVKIPNMELYKKGKLQEAYDKGVRVVLTRGQVREIVSHMSAEERAFANAVSAYYNGMSRNEINDTSEKLRGYAIAGVEKYYPIDSDGAFLRKEFDQLKRDGTLEGMGILKERIEGASNAIMLYDMNDTLNRSISQHSKYVGLAIPVRNFNRLYGVTTFKDKTTNYNQNAFDSTWEYDTSVIETIQKNWGSTATNYISKMMTDLQNGTGLKDDFWGGLLAKARSHYAGAVLTTNLSVAMKQAASYPTAAAVVGYGPLIKAFADRGKVDLDTLAKYTPLLWYRSKGFVDPELGDIGKEGIHIPKALNWIQGMDVATTTKLVKAAMIYVNENQQGLVRNTDAWWKVVAEVYNRIIEETQPNYTMMQRPQILRSDNALTRALNMFKTQPFQNFNILYDAFGNLSAKSREYKANTTQENLQALKSARANVARAVSSQVVSAFVFALMQFAWDAFRGKTKKYKDDEEELTFASWLKGMGINVLSSFGGMIPFGSYALELGEAMTDAVLKGFKLDPFFDQTFYGLSENAAESMNDMGNALISIVTKTTKALQGEATTETTIRGLVDGVADIAQFSGVPVSNVIKLAQSIARNVFLATDGQYLGEYKALRVTTDPAKYKSDYYALLKKAWTKDQAAYEELRKMMIEAPGDPFATSSKTAEQNIDAKVKDWIKEKTQQSEAKQTFYGTVYDEMTANSLWDKAPDEAKDKALEKLLSLALEMGVEGSDKNGAKYKAAIEGGTSVGLDATEYMLYTLALSMANPDGGTAKNAEYEEAINMVPGLSTEEKSYLWSTTHDSDKNNPWKVTRGGSIPTQSLNRTSRTPNTQGTGGNVYKTGEGLYNGYGFSQTGKPSEKRKRLESSAGADFYRAAWNISQDKQGTLDRIEEIVNDRALDFTKDLSGQPRAYDRLIATLAQLATDAEYIDNDLERSDYYWSIVNEMDGMDEKQREEFSKYLRSLGF